MENGHNLYKRGKLGLLGETTGCRGREVGVRTGGAGDTGHGHHCHMLTPVTGGGPGLHMQALPSIHPPPLRPYSRSCSSPNKSTGSWSSKWKRLLFCEPHGRLPARPARPTWMAPHLAGCNGLLFGSWSGPHFSFPASSERRVSLPGVECLEGTRGGHELSRRLEQTSVFCRC